MDARFVNPFIAATTNVVPQLGFKNVARGKVFTKEQTVDSLGVAVQVGISNQVTGNIIFNMSQESAKCLSSAMMMGAPVAVLDDMAQSAICELANMITSNAANQLTQAGIAVRLAPPSLNQGNGSLHVCNGSYIGIEMIIDELPIEIEIGINAS